ncbi:Arc family DNA-binding protein [Cereibacter sphaeroides]|jgi:hypothetical protein|uniref:Arc family DNA-binding protein n=1 Tax=Cereibacter sphaeroides TaxID=1063 RepID=UPI000066400C|nr:Arc domain protein DNA binding domain protein [Cereibacter sphaeroides ATCC 17029]
MSTATTRESDRYFLRLPDGMRGEIKAAAAANGRSMNAEIVHRLTGGAPGRLDHLEARVGQLEETVYCRSMLPRLPSGSIKESDFDWPTDTGEAAADAVPGNDCPCCGGSGHIDDASAALAEVRRATRDAAIREAATKLETTLGMTLRQQVRAILDLIDQVSAAEIGKEAANG